MVITPFAVLLLLIYTYILIKNKTTLKIFRSFIIVLAVVTLNIRMGYFFKIGDSMMAYRAVITYATTVIAIYLLCKTKRIPLKLFNCVVFFVLALMINLCIAKLYPYTGQINTINWVDYVMGERQYGYLDGRELEIGIYLVFICNCIILLAIKKTISKEDIHYIISKIIAYSKISIVLGFVEWIITNVFKSTIITKLCMLIFGSQGAQLDLLTQRGILYTIQGATKEPSMFATAIFYISILIIVESNKNNVNAKSNNRWLFCCLLLLVINPTLSSYIYLLIDFVLLFIFKMQGAGIHNKKGIIRRTIMTIIVSVFAFAFIYSNSQSWYNSSNYILHRLGNAFVQLENIIRGANLLYSSEAIRFSSIVYNFNMWIKRPLFGFGIGSLSCISGIVTFLVGGGIVCVVLYIAVLIRFSIIDRRYTFAVVAFTIIIFIIPNLLLNEYETIMCIVIPLSIYDYSLAVSNKTRIKEF